MRNEIHRLKLKSCYFLQYRTKTIVILLLQKTVFLNLNLYKDFDYFDELLSILNM